MDDLISEFLEETNESLEALDQDFVELEQNPDDSAIIGNIFRVMHTIKGTCGFLGLSRLEKVAHAGENIMDKLRDGVFKADPDVISLILEANDRIKAIIEVLEETEAEPEGSDEDIIVRLNACADANGVVEGGASSPAAEPEAVVADVAGTSDLDGEIDFTPVVADYAGGENGGDAPSEEAAAGTSDLDGEIDFTPVVADYAGGESAAEPEAAALPEIVPEVQVSQEVKKEAVSTGLKVATDDDKKKKTPSAQQSIRVGLDVLENLMQMVGELVLTRNQLLQLMRNSKDSDSELNTPMQRLNHITSELQEGVMQTRMQPIGNAWAKFPRLVRDLSLELGKKIELKMIGADTDLDRQMLEAIKDPLTHMVRNSADHGIEQPDARVSAGKPDTGTITLSAYHEGGHIIIKISDDGAGLNLDRIKAKALENAIVTESELEALSDKQIYQFIYKAGFSTAEAVTAVSGRGVGMDVVVSNIEKTGGHVEVNSWPGAGSEFLIKLPLTLAIMPVLIVQSGSEIFAIPQIKVSEIVRIDGAEELGGHHVETLNDSPVLRLRGRLLPLVSLADTLNISRDALYDNDNNSVDEVKLDNESEVETESAPLEDSVDSDESPISQTENNIEPFIVVCEVGSHNFGILVDKVFHTEEIVVKPNSRLIKNLDVYAGCTILGDGSVIMILDPTGIIRTAGVDGAAEEASEDDSKLNADNEIVSFLTFKTWDKTPKAVPLELVSRLEEIKIDDIEWSGGNQVVQYRGGLMKLTTFDASSQLPEEGIIEVIVFSDADRIMGLVVEEIIDIVRQNMDIKTISSDDGVMGSLVVDGTTTDLVDISHYFSQLFGDWLSSKDAIDISSGSGETGKKRILLVDDSPFFRKFMDPILVVSGYNVTSVESAAKGLEAMDDTDLNFDIIITDIDMPEMNGIEFAAKCREHIRYSDLPIIALSSHNESDLGESPDELGFNKFVSKADRNQLVSVISEIIHESNNQAA